jgi:nitrogen regulatory protein P-II 1
MNMKRIEAIVRPTKAADVCEALVRVGHPGMMITEIEGHGNQMGIEKEFHGKTYKVSLITKTRIEMVVEDGDVEKIIQTILDSGITGEAGDGKIFIHPVDEVIRVRTKERGRNAL